MLLFMNMNIRVNICTCTCILLIVGFLLDLRHGGKKHGDTVKAANILLKHSSKPELMLVRNPPLKMIKDIPEEEKEEILFKLANNWSFDEMASINCTLYAFGPRNVKIKVLVYTCTCILLIVGYLFVLRHGGKKHGDTVKDENPRDRNIVSRKWFRYDYMQSDKIKAQSSNKPEPMLVRNPPLKMTKDMPEEEKEDILFNYFETKDVICKQDVRVGHQDDGGWNACFSPPFGFREPCIVYSFGLADDWSFDEMASINCTVYVFDPSIPYPTRTLSPRLRYFPVGLSGKNGKTKEGWPVKTLSTLFRENGHENTVIEYLKFDIEFTEWSVFENILTEKTLQNVKQIGFEIHMERILKSKIMDGFMYIFDLFQKLESQKFRQFHYRVNPVGIYTSRLTNKKRSFF